MSTNPEAFLRGARQLALDPVGVHHEFRTGVHGRKYDLSKLEGSRLYGDMVDLNVGLIEGDMAEDQPLVIVGIDSGTIDFAKDVAEKVEHPNVQAVKTEKHPETNALSFTELARDAIWALRGYGPKVVLLDDVGTTGSTLVPLFVDAVDYLEADDVIAQYTIQRNKTLSRLEGKYRYRAVVVDPQRDYTPEECAKRGWCSRGWELKPYTKPRLEAF